MSCRQGFTLIEVVVAVSIGVLVAAASLAALSAVFRGWTRLAAGGRLLDADRAMLRVERDVASSCPLPDAAFAGGPDRLRIPLEQGGALRVVEWSVVPEGLLRAERDYRFEGEAGYDGREDDGRSTALRTEWYRVPGPASFSYAALVPADDAPAWVERWSATSPTNLPGSVRILLPGNLVREMPCRLL